MPQAPQVIDGMRAPRSTRMDDMRNAGNTEPVLPAAADGHTVYISKYRSYRVQITSPRNIIDPYTGQKQVSKPVAAQFEDGVYRNRERNPELRALIDKTLQANPYFGPFSDGHAHFWLADDQKAKMEKARIQSALDTLRSLPKEAVDEFIGALKQGDADDHDLGRAE